MSCRWSKQTNENLTQFRWSPAVEAALSSSHESWHSRRGSDIEPAQPTSSSYVSASSCGSAKIPSALHARNQGSRPVPAALLKDIHLEPVANRMGWGWNELFCWQFQETSLSAARKLVKVQRRKKHPPGIQEAWRFRRSHIHDNSSIHAIPVQQSNLTLSPPMKQRAESHHAWWPKVTCLQHVKNSI